MTSLRTLSDDHYHNRISFIQYREQRSQLLNLIDEDLNGIKNSINNEVEQKKDMTLVDKALSFLKIDKFKESN